MTPNKELNQDKFFVSWSNTLKPRTKAIYGAGLRKFCEYAEKTPSELVEEARQEYISRVAPWDLRHVQRVESFMTSLDTGMANYTKLSYLNGIRNFYKFNRMPLVVLNIPTIPGMATEAYLDTSMLKIEDIRKAVQTAEAHKLLKALILTLLSSGQGQAEIQKLKGRHLKNIVNGVAIVDMTREKKYVRYIFFIGPEALEAIREYKPQIKDDEYVFTQKKISNKKLEDAHIDSMFKALSKKLGFKKHYFVPHRFRHFFKTRLTGRMDTRFIEYLMGHRLPGTESNYFKGEAVQGDILKAYINNLPLLTVYTDKEVLQKQYDELKQKYDLRGTELESRLARLESIWNPPQRSE